MTAVYSKDLEPDLEGEIIQFKAIEKHFSKEKLSMNSLQEAIKTSKLKEFPNIKIASKRFMFITMLQTLMGRELSQF